MTRATCLGIWWILVVGPLLGCCGHALAQEPNRIAYWRAHYQELTPDADARVARAQHIFAQLVQVAGTRRGVSPRLLVLKDDPWGIALPIALPDGWIVLSKGALSLCYQEPRLGDDRLAFVLGHELAHLIQDHFWHIKYFQAWEATQAQGAPSAKPPDLPVEELWHQEFQADTNGILYATMAGFSPLAIIAHHRQENFFQTWVDAWNPERIGRRPDASTHPTAQQRADVLQASLQRVVQQAAAFQAGLWWIYAGDYAQAVRAFEDFLEFFPAREVYHNLALSHHLLALQAYQFWKPESPPLPFQFALTVEPVTRASRIYVAAQSQRGAASHADAETLFRRHLDEAIALYRQAMDQDATDTLGALNLAHALIVRGLQSQTQGLSADVVEAQAVLLRAQQNEANENLRPQLLNALGVVSYYTERIPEAKQLFTRARTLAPAEASPVFNLGYLAHLMQQPAEAKRYRRAYQQLVQKAATISRDLPVEQVMGTAIGHFTDEVPSAWGEPTESTFELGKMRLTLSAYPGGIMTLSQHGEILMLGVQRGFSGTSGQGIAVGSPAQAVRSRYGAPTRHLAMPRGETWSYDRHRIAFHLQNGQVVGWLVY
jgi:tetratricopeptide (TPR) repeat protein